MKTDAERKRDERERRKALGLVRIEAWVPPKYVERIKRYIEKLIKRS